MNYIFKFLIISILFISISIILYVELKQKFQCSYDNDCKNNKKCINGKCQPCTPNCLGGECTKDGCGGVCPCDSGDPCINGTQCVKPSECTFDSDCDNNKKCINKMCKNVPDPSNKNGYYCVVDGNTDLNSCKKITSSPYPTTGYHGDDSNCGNVCDNKCSNNDDFSCGPNNLCLSGICVKCSSNKVNINNALDGSEWIFEYAKNKPHPHPLVFYNGKDQSDTPFFLYENEQRWDILKHGDGMFDMQSVNIKGPNGPNKLLWKNFSMVENNTYLSTEEIISGKLNTEYIMRIYPKQCPDI